MLAAEDTGCPREVFREVALERAPDAHAQNAAMAYKVAEGHDTTTWRGLVVRTTVASQIDGGDLWSAAHPRSPHWLLEKVECAHTAARWHLDLERLLARLFDPLLAVGSRVPHPDQQAETEQRIDIVRGVV